MAATKQRIDPNEDAVKAALKEVGRAEAAYEKLLVQEQNCNAQYQSSKDRAEGSDSTRSQVAVRTARERAKSASKRRREALANLREARSLLREQQQLARDAERKERAKQRAVAAFLKQWEREYDLEMKRKKKNIKLRKREVRGR